MENVNKISFTKYCMEKCNIPSTSIDNNNCYIFCHSILHDFFSKATKDINKKSMKIELLYK